MLCRGTSTVSTHKCAFFCQKHFTYITILALSPLYTFLISFLIINRTSTKRKTTRIRIVKNRMNEILNANEAIAVQNNQASIPYMDWIRDCLDWNRDCKWQLQCLNRNHSNQISTQLNTTCKTEQRYNARMQINLKG